MANIREMAEVRTLFYCSSSIANFYPKLKAYLKLEDYDWQKHRNDRVIFFGLYHWKDYLRFLTHKGPKKVFWCGSDILNLVKHPFWEFLISQADAKHYCENFVERDLLMFHNIVSEVRPMLFDDPDKYQICYKWSDNPRWFATYHKGREQEYGFQWHPNIFFLENYSEDDFNEKIKEFQGAIRFNEFDGFAETLAKSVLMGQYPISKISYPYIWQLGEGHTLPKEPNYEASNYWRKTLKENKYEVVDHWNG